ncbi:MAG: DEAD/DEAH box helicase family protein [Bacteroidetes bacterium]|nr:DEAD/DEAH box helicase family protein [Bacteroidota bacterium]
MEKEIRNISQRLSLREPQRESLAILAKVAEIVTPKHQNGEAVDLNAALLEISNLYPTVKSFERDFPSLCFALATGVGKTRLMGAFISYLHNVHGLKHFFVLAPNLTIYNKLISDFTPNTPKYVFQGIAAFATNVPWIITGENYDEKGSLLDRPNSVQINIFNISKINSEVRGGKSPKIRQLKEYLGQSYFDYLAGLPDLVMLMDESHRYRASAGIRAINELKPVLGLELTATPFIEGARGAVPFQNVIYDYPLARAMEDGFVKEPAVSTRKNFSAVGKTPEEIEELKLADGVRMHQNTKIDLQTYAQQNGVVAVKPFMLVIARDTVHAKKLVELISSQDFFEGRYANKVIQVDSSKTGAEEEEMINRLLKVEDSAEPTEIVVHVNMLKEGWDVTNLYTIVPLRAANARILIEQSIGRGLRLPYGKRTGVEAVDRLNIVAHDKFQEILDEANRKDSPLRLKQIIFTEEELEQPREVIVSQNNVTGAIQLQKEGVKQVVIQGLNLSAITATQASVDVANHVVKVIEEMAKEPDFAPTTASLSRVEVQEKIVARTLAKMEGTQLAFDGIGEKPDVKAIAATVTELVKRQTIDIPRIVIVPKKGKVEFVFTPFTLDVAGIRPEPMDKTIVIQDLRTAHQTTLIAQHQGIQEPRLANHLVRRLMNYPEVDYNLTSDLLFDLAEQMIAHIGSYLSEEDTANTVRENETRLASYIYAQMREHLVVASEAGFEEKVMQGYDKLKESVFAANAGKIFNFRDTPEKRSEIRNYVYTGFTKCLFEVQKFDSYPELIMARILEREALKWFKPALGQFQIFYNTAKGQRQYNPDFVAETEEEIIMIEVKRESELENAEVLAKRDAAEKFCGFASVYGFRHGGKRWRYLLVGESGVKENMGLG